MKRRLFGVLGGIGLLAALLLGPMAAPSLGQAQYPPSAVGCRVSATIVPRGGTVVLTAFGFRARTTIVIDLLSTPVRLASVVTDADGAFVVTLKIPESTSLGTHSLRLTGLDPAGQLRSSICATITVVDAGAVMPKVARGPGGGLSKTGSSSTAPLTAAGVGLVVIGTAAVVVARRRRMAMAAEG